MPSKHAGSRCGKRLFDAGNGGVYSTMCVVVRCEGAPPWVCACVLPSVVMVGDASRISTSHFQKDAI